MAAHPWNGDMGTAHKKRENRKQVEAVISELVSVSPLGFLHEQRPLWVR